VPEPCSVFCPSIIAVIDSLVGPGLRTEQAGPTGYEGPITYLATLCISSRIHFPVSQYGPPVGCQSGRGRGGPRCCLGFTKCNYVVGFLPSDHGRRRHATSVRWPRGNRQMNRSSCSQAPCTSRDTDIRMSFDWPRIGWFP